MPVKNKKPALKSAVQKSKEYVSLEEQNQILFDGYTEAMRYMENADKQLVQARREGKYYKDAKYVKGACGIAYSGVLVALDCYLLLKGYAAVEKDERRSMSFYMKTLSMLDKTMAKTYDCLYKILHLSGYYDGITNATVLKEGFEEAMFIISKIKPIDGVESNIIPQSFVN
jgi:hypothetical protein